MSGTVPAREGILRFIEILVEGLRVAGRDVRVVKVAGVEDISGIGGADIILSDMGLMSVAPANLIAGRMSGDSLLVVLDVMASINRRPELLKELGMVGLTKSLIPLDGGAAATIKRGYGADFFRKTVEVYRESFIHGPNPVDYNTATALYILAKFLTARRGGTIVEVGTGRGFSTLWLAHAAKETDSHVISIDSRCDRVDYAKNVLEDLGLGRYVEVICTDARNYVHGGRDVTYVFIDGKKDEYHKYLEALEPHLQPGALLLAHNTLSDAHLIKPYMEKVYTGPYRSITVATDPKGLTISAYAPQ